MESSTTRPTPDTLHFHEGKWYELRDDGSYYEVDTPNRRPNCKACGSTGPTIDGYCVPHMHVRTEGLLHCVSPEQMGL